VDARIKNEITKKWDEVLDHEYDLVEAAQNSRSSDDAIFVDVGCGALGLLGRKPGRLAALQAQSLGIDIDQEALARNPYITYRACASCYSLPLKDNSVDVVACRWLFEHLESPDKAIREFGRVLKKGGILYIKTPNLWNYSMLFSQVTPTFVHNMFRSMSGYRDNIPTFYRANTKKKLAELASQCGFEVSHLETYSYSYMYYAFNKEVFHAMRGVSRMMGKISNNMQQTLFCVLRKV
jgi:SAM-dependent methyltransferase